MSYLWDGIVRARGVLRTLSNIYDGAFGENSKRLLTVNYFCKKISIADVCQGLKIKSLGQP